MQFMKIEEGVGNLDSTISVNTPHHDQSFHYCPKDKNSANKNNVSIFEEKSAI